MVGIGMVVVGVDAYKRTHTLVAVDQVGRKLAERTVAAISDGHLAGGQLGRAVAPARGDLRTGGLPIAGN